MKPRNSWLLIFLEKAKESKGYLWSWVVALGCIVVFGASVSISNFFNDDYKVSTFTLYDKYSNSSLSESESDKIVQLESNFRGIASENPTFACLSDNIRLENMKREVQKIENKISSSKIESKMWKGMDLSKLPGPQAQFILEFESFITTSQNLGACKDLPCALNKIYKDESEYSGYLSYFWYLKTGTMLSMTNNIPGFDSTGFKSSEFLFSKPELMNFWKLASGLPSSFLHIPGLKTIHKIPSTLMVPGHSIAECNISLGTGQLFFKSNCLESNNSFYINVMASMAKQLDLSLTAKSGFSQNPEWLELSKWKTDEFWHSKAQTYTQNWVPTAPMNFFVSKKSATHPARQFSELLALFRYAPNAVKDLNPKLKEFISLNFFDGHNYSKKGLLQQYIRYSNKKWEEQENKMWTQCLDQHFTVEYIDGSMKNKDSFSKMNSGLFSCMDKKIPAFVSSILSKIKKEKYEGCDFFNHEQYQNEADTFIEVLSKNINKKIYKVHFALEKWGVQYLIGLKIKDEISAKLDSTGLFISCHVHKDTKKCFNNKIKVMTKKLVSHYDGVSSEYIKVLQDEIQNENRFLDVKEESNKKIKTFLFPYFADLKNESKEIWKICINRSIDFNESMNEGLSFNGGLHYVSPSLLNCINSKVSYIIQSVLSKTIVSQNKEAEFNLHSYEKDYATKILKPRLMQYFKEYTELNAANEKLAMDDYFRANAHNLMTVVLSDEDFLVDVYSKDQINERCLDRISENFPEKYHFHTEAQLADEFSSGICQKILASDKIKRTVASSINDEWSVARKSIITEYKENFQSRINNCYDKYSTKLSINLVKNSVSRKRCFEESHTASLENSIREWLDKDSSKYFVHKETEIRREIHVLKDEIIKNIRKSERVLRQ